MDQYYPVIIQGVFLTVYIIVFIIQKTQIKSLKETNQSMKTFMDIFKVDEVKKYVELTSENSKMKAINLIKEEGKLSEIIEKVVKEQEQYIVNLKTSQMKEELIELLDLTFDDLKNKSKEEREEILNTKLPKSKRHFTDKF